ncbi:hypothetical protein F5Y03DRAFT_365732 [Xylaria venustula]|nr:hypothetical protein F5Y03DRAFT_365732 [Xylaria venustula]
MRRGRSIRRCWYCRNDKKKCIGQPGQKCKWCIKKRLPCSDYMTTEEERQRSRNVSQPTPRLPPPMPSTIGDTPLSQKWLLLLSYHQMLFRVESVANTIHVGALTRDCASFDRRPDILGDIETCSMKIMCQLLDLRKEVSELPNTPHCAELSSVIRSLIEAHPNRHNLEYYLEPLRGVTAAGTGTESRSPYDAEQGSTDIEREVETIMNGPKLYSDREDIGQFTATYMGCMKSLEERFSAILGEYITLPVPFLHDFWYQHAGERDRLFSKLLRDPGLSMFCQDCLGRTPLHFAVEEMRFEDQLQTDTLNFAGTPIKLLLQYQPHWLDARDAFGRTALHIACASKNDQKRDYQLRIARTLLQNNAKIDACDEYGRRAIDYAIIDRNNSLLNCFRLERELNLNSIYSAINEIEHLMRTALSESASVCQGK